MVATPTVEKGTKVRVSFEADYHDKTALGRHVFKDGNTAPADAKVEVIAPPLPPEPEGYGTLVKVAYADTIYKRTSRGWWKITGNPEHSGVKYHTWRQICDEWGRGELIPLVYDPTRGAEDMREKPYLIGAKAGPFGGEMTAQVKDFEVAFKLPCGDTVMISDFDARRFAKAILKSTGGL